MLGMSISALDTRFAGTVVPVQLPPYYYVLPPRWNLRHCLKRSGGRRYSPVLEKSRWLSTTGDSRPSSSPSLATLSWPTLFPFRWQHQATIKTTLSAHVHRFPVQSVASSLPAPPAGQGSVVPSHCQHGAVHHTDSICYTQEYPSVLCFDAGRNTGLLFSWLAQKKVGITTLPSPPSQATYEDCTFAAFWMAWIQSNLLVIHLLH
jgi:hypothetical protein